MKSNGWFHAHKPFWVFFFLSVGLGLLDAWVVVPFVTERLWQLDTNWGWDSRGWFFGATVTFLAFLFAATNFMLRLLDRDGLRVTLPPLFQTVNRLRPLSALGWAGFIPLAVGMVIGKTIFT